MKLIHCNTEDPKQKPEESEPGKTTTTVQPGKTTVETPPPAPQKPAGE